jgi:hypothetical protein
MEKLTMSTIENRTITENQLDHMTDEIRDLIAWKLPVTLTDDEMTRLDTAVLYLLHDLFTVDENDNH